MIKEFNAGTLNVQVYGSRQEMGAAAAKAAAVTIQKSLGEKDEVNIIFAAAASQNEFLDALAIAPNLDWGRVNVFHMDEYTGLPKEHPQRFGNFLYNKIFKKLPLKHIYYLNEEATDDQAEADRYAQLLTDMPTDITFMGIGENTHLAFNDPHVADFKDPYLVKIIDLDEPCKAQQVGDGCFPTVADVPPLAYTLTIPALLKARHIFCMVPGKNKAPAVKHTIEDDITEKYPSTIIKTHPGAILFLDQDSSSLL